MEKRTFWKKNKHKLRLLSFLLAIALVFNAIPAAATEATSSQRADLEWKAAAVSYQMRNGLLDGKEETSVAFLEAVYAAAVDAYTNESISSEMITALDKLLDVAVDTPYEPVDESTVDEYVTYYTAKGAFYKNASYNSDLIYTTGTGGTLSMANGILENLDDDGKQDMIIAVDRNGNAYHYFSVYATTNYGLEGFVVDMAYYEDNDLTRAATIDESALTGVTVLDYWDIVNSYNNGEAALEVEAAAYATGKSYLHGIIRPIDLSVDSYLMCVWPTVMCEWQNMILHLDDFNGLYSLTQISADDVPETVTNYFYEQEVAARKSTDVGTDLLTSIYYLQLIKEELETTTTEDVYVTLLAAAIAMAEAALNNTNVSEYLLEDILEALTATIEVFTTDTTEKTYEGDDGETVTESFQLGLTQATLAQAQVYLTERTDEYTAESLATLQEYVDTLTALYEKVVADDYAGGVTQEEINTACNAVVLAILNLELSEEEEDETGGSSESESEEESTTLDYTNLEDGIYYVYAEMVKPDWVTASMSNNAINHTITITVVDGEYTIMVEFKGLTIGTSLGYLSTLQYFLTGYTTNAYNTPEGDLGYATVLSYQTEDDGTLVSDTFGTDYPATVSFPMIPEALDVDDNEYGYVPLQVFVPIMEAIATGNGTQQVYMAIHWATITADADEVEDDSTSSDDSTSGTSLSTGSTLGTSSLSSGTSTLSSGTSSLSSTIKTGDTAQLRFWLSLALAAALFIFTFATRDPYPYRYSYSKKRNKSRTRRRY